MSQVAVYKILESIGEKPSLSHPDEDAFHAIDLWVQPGMTIQTKMGKHVETPALLETEHLAFPAVKARNKKESRYYNSKYFHESERFRAKIRNYGKMKGEKIKGFMLIIPFSKIDRATGEPSSELTEFFRNKI